MIKTDIFSESQKKLFDLFRNQSWISDFYLAGGTALSLLIGHRKSDDFDFFNSKKFKNDLILKNISDICNFNLLSEDVNTLYISIDNIRFSFISHQYNVLEPFLKTDYLNISNIRDIACNKLSAISSRGSKKDFIDLYFILKTYNIEDLFVDYKTKYGVDYFNEYLLLKSLVYFEDAEFFQC